MRLLLRLTLLVGTIAILLLVAEGVCRLRIHQANQSTLQSALENPPPPSENATLRDIIRMSHNDRIAYELKPGLKDVSFKGSPLSTNSFGFRGPEIPVDEPPNGVTVVGIGDSILFGHGVGDGETYMDRLRELLIEGHPDTEWRTVNTGVPGYNTVMEVATLEEKILAFDPDVVVLGLCTNDYSPPNYVRVEDDVWDLSRSFLIEFVNERLAGDEPGARFRNETLTFRKKWAESTDSGHAPPRYANLYGRAPSLAALDRLQELAAQEDFQVITLLMFGQATNGAIAPGSQHQNTKRMLRDCKIRGFRLLEMQPILEQALEDDTEQPFSWELYLQSDLAAGPTNGHPSKRLHSMAARLLYDDLVSSGTLAEFVSDD